MIYAGFWIRFAAHLIDFVLLNGVEQGLEYGISVPMHLDAFTQQGVGVVLYLVMAYFYYVWAQVKYGATPGKRIFSIVVVDEATQKFMTVKQALLRLIGYVASYAILGCGFLMAAFHPQKKTIHDLLAGTVSVRIPRAKKT